MKPHIFLFVLCFFLIAENCKAGNSFYSEIRLLAQTWDTVQEVDADFDALLATHGIKEKVDIDSISVSVIGKDGKLNPISNMQSYNQKEKKLFLKVPGESDDKISLKKYRIHFQTGNNSIKSTQELKKEIPEQRLFPENDQYIFKINKIRPAENNKPFFPFEIQPDFQAKHIILIPQPSHDTNHCFKVLPSLYKFSIDITGKDLDPKVWKVSVIIGWWSESEKKMLVPFCETTLVEIKGIKEIRQTTFEKIFTPPPDTDYAYFIVFINKMNPGGTIWLDKPQIKMIDIMNLNNLFMEKENDSK